MANIDVHAEWKPLEVLIGDEPTALIVLNQPLLQQSRMLIKKCWNTAILRIAADGGLLHLKEMDDGEQKYIPDIVCGDFDSLSEDDIDEYSKLGSHIVHTPDQDETDFTKSLTVCAETLLNKGVQVKSVLAFCNNGNRVDHVMANLNTLYIALKKFPFSVYLIGEQSLSWILNTGSHKISLTEEFVGSYIGLVPLGSPCTNVTTTGLKWNLSGGEMKFGDLVSTSNRWNETDCITINNNSPLVFTITFTLSID